MLGNSDISKNNSETTAIKNRKLVLRLLRERGPLIRKEIADITSLHRSTITYIINELFELNLIRYNNSITRVYKGKQLHYLEINPDWGYVIGLEPHLDYCRIVATDISSNVIFRRTVDWDARSAVLTDEIVKLVTSIRAEREVAKRRLIGVGIAMPGIVDVQNNAIVFSREFDLRDSTLAAEISARINNLPVYIENNANAAAIAELNFGALKEERHGLFLFFEATKIDHEKRSGFAFGIVINRQVYHGYNYQAGEVDDFLLPFEDYKFDVQELSKKHDDSVVKFIEHLSHLIAVVTDFLDPHRVIIGSNAEIEKEVLIDLLREQFDKKTLRFAATKEILIDYSALGVDVGALGATMLIINSLLDPDSSATDLFDAALISR